MGPAPKLNLEMVQQLYKEGNTTLAYFEDKFGVSKKTVQRAFKKLGLSSISDFERELQKKLPDMINLYKDGLSIMEVCKKFDVHVTVLRPRLKELGIYRNEQPRYQADYDFFEVIDTEEKAYWLGFIAADGCVKGLRSMKIGISSIDIEVLEKFKESLNATYPIKYETKWKENDHVNITLTNQKLYDDLISKGIVPNKTHILQFPSEDIVPKDLLNHYVRGYFDGDGCVTGSIQPNVNFTGNKDFLLPLQSVLIQEANVRLTKPSTRRPESPNIITIMWSGRGNARKLYDYMYKDATIFLNRKHEKFLGYF